MIYLRPRNITWSYKRGNKNLQENMKKTIIEKDFELVTNIEANSGSTSVSN